MQFRRIIPLSMGKCCAQKDAGVRQWRDDHQFETENPQGQSDTGRNPSSPLFPEPLQEHNTKALIPSKIKLPADRILLEEVGGCLTSSQMCAGKTNQTNDLFYLSSVSIDRRVNVVSLRDRL